jgi:acyl carrier protein
MVEELMLPQSAEEIADDALIFSPQGLGLDSVDALQLVVALEKRFGLKLADAAAARETLRSVDTIADAVAANAG